MQYNAPKSRKVENEQPSKQPLAVSSDFAPNVSPNTFCERNWIDPMAVLVAFSGFSELMAVLVTVRTNEP